MLVQLENIFIMLLVGTTVQELLMEKEIVLINVILDISDYLINNASNVHLNARPAPVLLNAKPVLTTSFN